MSKRKNIAVAVNDDEKIWKSHFGMAPFFNIYSVDGKLIEKRKNPYGRVNGKHEHHDNPSLIVELLNDCKIFIAKRMGTESKRKLLKNFGISALLTEEVDLEKVLKQFLRSNE